jgi:hypothetical protein
MEPVVRETVVMPVTWSDCVHCNGPLPPGATVCPGCGSAVGDDLPTATALRGDAAAAVPTQAGPSAQATDPSGDGLRPPQAPDEIGRLGGYRVLGRLGAGGMGAVYRAEDPQLRRLVALKVMLPKIAADPNAKDRFLREARAAAAVEHDHIIPIHQVGEDHGTAFLAMPLLKGETLADRLKRERPLPVTEALRIGREVALGLAAAHAEGLIHRDIKPANIWLEGTGRRVKILDFGLARSASSEDGDWLTDPGSIVGTPAYMSPEQARNDPLDGRSDLFSLGTVLYEMTTGRLPFRGKTATAVLTALAVDDPRPPTSVDSAVPSHVSDFILRLLSKNPADRPATAAAVARDLGRLLTAATVTPLDAPAAGVWGQLEDGAPPGTGKATGSRSPSRKGPDLRWLGLGAIVVAGAVALIGQLATSKAPKENPVVERDDPKVEVAPKKNGAVQKDVPETKPKGAGAGLLFDGKSTRVVVPTLTFDGKVPVTVEAWVTPTAFGQEGHICLLGRPGGGMGFSPTGSFGAGVFDGSGWRTAYGSNVPVGKKVHLAAVFAADGITLYIDGKTTTTKAHKLAALPKTEPPAVLGAHTPEAAPGHFQGTMHAVRVSKSARYVTDFKPADRWEKDADTVALYRFDDGAGTRLTDHSGHDRHGTIENGTWAKAK